MQSDDKILAVGSSTLGATRNIGLVRYNTNGAPDGSFDTDGILVTDIGDDFVTSAILQTDGKILVGGQTIFSPAVAPEFLAIRYNTDGSIDNCFDGDGKAITPLGVSGSGRPNSILLQSDGRILLASSAIDIPDTDIAIVRHNSDGTLDTSFDADGKAIYELPNAGDAIYDTAIQPDGKIVAVGYAFNNQRIVPAVSRFAADGSIDTGFGENGSHHLIVPELAQSFVSCI